MSRWRQRQGFIQARFRDADQAAEAMPGSRVEFSPKLPAKCSWRMQEASFGESRLVTSKWPTAVVANGVIDADTIVFAFGVTHSQRLSVNGTPMGPDSIAYMPQHETFVIATQAQSRRMALQISRPAFERELRTHSGTTATARNALAVMRPGMEQQRKLHQVFNVALRFSARHAILLPGAGVGDRLQGRVLHQLLRCVHDSPVDAPSPHRSLIARMREYLEHNRDVIVEQWDLCRELAIGDRALRRLFADVYGTSPGRYLRQRRLGQAHRALRDATALSVTEVAIALGFFDLGRFARDYRTHFGELPSQTLHRDRIDERG